MNVDTSIFKAYDIRGVYGETLHDETALAIGKAFADFIKSDTGKETPTVVVSRDMRLSSPALHDAVIEGITSQGVSVVDIGLASTPTFYFSVGFLGHDGGIQVSASHNPSEWNGFKMVRAKGVPVSGDTGIYEIRDAAAAGEFTDAETKGEVSHYDTILEDLIREQTKEFDLEKIKPLKIVADAANSMGALDLEALFAVIPGELIKVNFELDGTFPSHEADPLKEENLELLKEKIKEHNADLGIAMDGDGDRIFFVDNEAQTIPPEIIRGILAAMILRDHAGATIGYDIRPGKITRDMIEENGGVPFVTKVGHSLIKEEMIKRNSPFSGESSGHFFYKSEYGSYESPVRVTINFLLWLTEQDTPAAEAIAPLKRYYHSGEINSVVESKDAVFAALKTKYANAKNIDELDGVLIEFDDFWFNVRGSNTEPKIRLNLEAVSPEVMAEKRDEVLSVIRGE